MLKASDHDLHVNDLTTEPEPPKDGLHEGV